MVISDEYQRAVEDTALEQGIQWEFIPPFSPHQGGLHESAIKQCKYHLKRVIGTDIYTYDQMNTLLVQVEACLNSRPLMPLSNDPQESLVLTPAHFLVGESLKANPEPNLLQIPENRLDRYQLIQQKLQSFWKKWQHEYLLGLQIRSKWVTSSPNVKEDMLVLVEDKNAPPMKWKIGRIEKVYHGIDGLVRVVKIRTSLGSVHRSIQHIAPLPWN